MKLQHVGVERAINSSRQSEVNRNRRRTIRKKKRGIDRECHFSSYISSIICYRYIMVLKEAL